MHEALKVALSLSLSGSMIAVLLLVLRPLFEKSLSRGWQYYIWLIVVLRLLVPLAPQGMTPVAAVFDGIERSMAQSAASPLPMPEPYEAIDQLPLKDQGVHAATIPAQVDPARQSDSPQDILRELASVLWIIWLGGAVVLLMRRVIRCSGYTRYIRVGWRRVTDDAVLEAYRSACCDIGVRREPRLYTNPMAASPMLLGVFHPVIVLPGTSMAPQELRMILQHELLHYKRKDILYKWLVQIAVCLHWFNPIVHWIEREIDKACELSCDEQMIRRLDEEDRHRYGRVLLNATQAGDAYGDRITSITLSKEGKLLKKRLNAILRFRGRKRAPAILAASLSLILTACTAYAGAYDPDRPEPKGAPQMMQLAMATPHQGSASSDARATPPPTPLTKNEKNVPRQMVTVIADFDRIDIDMNDIVDHIDTTVELLRFSDGYIIGMRYQSSARWEAQSRTAELPDRVAFMTAKQANHMKSKAFEGALAGAIEAFWEVLGDGSSEDRFVTVTEVAGPYAQSPDELMEKFYREENIAYFNSVLPVASDEARRGILTRAVDEARVAEVALMILFAKDMDADIDALARSATASGDPGVLALLILHISAKGAMDAAQIAYENDDIACFTLLAGKLSKGDRAVLHEKAKRDRRIKYTAVLIIG